MPQMSKPIILAKENSVFIFLYESFIKRKTNRLPYPKEQERHGWYKLVSLFKSY